MLQEVEEKLENKKDLELQGLVILRIHCLEVEVEFLVLDQEIMILNLIKKLRF